MRGILNICYPSDSGRTSVWDIVLDRLAKNETIRDF